MTARGRGWRGRAHTHPLSGRIRRKAAWRGRGRGGRAWTWGRCQQARASCPVAVSSRVVSGRRVGRARRRFWRACGVRPGGGRAAGWGAAWGDAGPWPAVGAWGWAGGSWPGEADRAADAGAARGIPVQALQGGQEAGVAGFVPVFAGRRRGDFHASEGFGQKRVRQQPGRAGQGATEVELADEDQEGEAEDAVGAAAGFDDLVLDLPQGVVGGGAGQGLKKFFPEAGMGEAAEVAGDGVRLAVLRGEGVPGCGGGGDVEDAFHALAKFTDGAALGGAGEEVGEEGGELERGEGRGHKYVSLQVTANLALSGAVVKE